MKLQKSNAFIVILNRCAGEGHFYEECHIIHVDRTIALEKLPFFSHQCNNDAKIIGLKIL